MNCITPEQADVKSENVEKYLGILEGQCFATRNITMAKGDQYFL